VECRVDGKWAKLAPEQQIMNQPDSGSEYVLRQQMDQSGTTVLARGNSVPRELVEAYEAGEREEQERYQRLVAEHGQEPAYAGPYIVRDPNLLIY
jgi:hypothetical protein